MRIAFLLLFICSLGFSQEEITTKSGRIVVLYDNGSWIYKDLLKDYSALELPACNEDSIVRHQAYSLLYNEQHEQAEWVAYKLRKEDLIKVASRTDNFRPDPLVKTGSAEIPDYKSSGFDRGHLAPAGDMVRSKEVMSESFYFSNMSPQKPGFNRGVWRLLEEHVRKCVKEFDSVYVVTGPVLEDDLLTIGPNEVSIPKYYYKVLLRFVNGYPTAIGYILPNESSKKPYNSYEVSVDSVESFTGINFFSTLNDTIEEKIESTICEPCWQTDYHGVIRKKDYYDSQIHPAEK